MFPFGVEVDFTRMWGFYLEGSEYEFNCLRTDKQTVNVDGLFVGSSTIKFIFTALKVKSLPSTPSSPVSNSHQFFTVRHPFK